MKNKGKAFLTGIGGFLLIGSLVATRSTDGYFVGATIGFFLVCAAYAEWCERL
jgi:hypothetical protein